MLQITQFFYSRYEHHVGYKSYEIQILTNFSLSLFALRKANPGWYGNTADKRTGLIVSHWAFCKISQILLNAG